MAGSITVLTGISMTVVTGISMTVVTGISMTVFAGSGSRWPGQGPAHRVRPVGGYSPP
jgi:hypothetical protein